MKEKEFNLLISIGRLVKAIDNEIDWFLLYVREKDKNQKRLFYSVYLNKCEELKKITKEEVMKYEK